MVRFPRPGAVALVIPPEVRAADARTVPDDDDDDGDAGIDPYVRGVIVPQSHAITILRLPAVVARTGLSKSTLNRLMVLGDFPKPVQLSARCVGWPERLIDAWLASKIQRAAR